VRRSGAAFFQPAPSTLTLTAVINAKRAHSMMGFSKSREQIKARPGVRKIELLLCSG
jgi:hypothetical protein